MAVGDNEGELRNDDEMIMMLDGEHGRKGIKNGNDDDGDKFDEKHEGIDETEILNNER